MNSLLIKNAFILSNTDSDDFFPGHILVENGKIKKILSKTEDPESHSNTVDLKYEQVIIPGFIQTHTHLCQTLFRNLADDLELLDWLKQKIWPMEAAHDYKSMQASARLGISELLASGTTTILDMASVNHTDAVFEAAQELGIRAFIGKCMMDRDDMPAGLKESTQDSIKECTRLIENWHGKENSRLNYAFAPRFALSCTETLFQELGSIAQDRKLIVHTHSSENQSEIEAVRKLYGCENIEFFKRIGLTGSSLVLAHGIHLSDSEIKILVDSKTNISHCPSSNLKLASGIAPVPKLQKEGVCVSLGADGAACNNNLDMFKEMRLASLIQKPEHGPKAMSAKNVFKMATIEGAKALGIDSEVGSIEVDKRADLVALDLKQVHSTTELKEGNSEELYGAIAFSCDARNVSRTWVDGKLVFTRDNFDQKKLHADAISARDFIGARI